MAKEVPPKRYMVEIDGDGMQDIGINPTYEVIEVTGQEEIIYFEGEDKWIGCSLDDLKASWSRPNHSETEFNRKRVLKQIAQIEAGTLIPRMDS